MENHNEIIKWIKNYDSDKYPTGIYDELVVEGKEREDKISLMGAWKTGSLRVDYSGNEYQDRQGNRYGYTKRWKVEAPVGYTVWNDISNNQKEYKDRIPSEFPLTAPGVVKELLNRQGFGFIWTLFVLHCFYPRIYPLYDQHVYRAYMYMVSNGKITTIMAPNSWDKYIDYKRFFDNLLIEIDIEFWELDRALWAYGKELKNGSAGKGKLPEVKRSYEIQKETFPIAENNVSSSHIFNLSLLVDNKNADKLFRSLLERLELKNIDYTSSFTIEEIVELIPKGTEGVSNYATYGFSITSMLSNQKGRDYFIFDDVAMTKVFTDLCKNSNRDNYVWKKHYIDKKCRINPKYYD